MKQVKEVIAGVVLAIIGFTAGNLIADAITGQTELEKLKIENLELEIELTKAKISNSEKSGNYERSH